MSKIPPTPAYDNIADPVTGKASRAYLEFFDALYRGDRGQSWTPTFTGLTIVGAPTISGTYYQFGALVYFSVLITPVTSTSSTFGTTYINNFPLRIASDTSCVAVTNAPSVASGMVDSATQRIYPPTWAAITSPITISGTLAAS